MAQNTTSVIPGKTFNVTTVECPFSSLMGSAENGVAPSICGSSNKSNFANNGASVGGIFKSFKLNPNAVMQAKMYEFKATDKTYRLILVVSNLFTSTSTSTSQSPEKNQIYQSIPHC